ncbi:hypothetical protein [Pseudoalteromonas sp. PA2MD11]|uniref:hypothetical protein n=1 Tax=Pseudoalteromonas sp. PA2MD11 TaxID=2785057 RepID=UPI001AE099E1|nr:hypothetical protein [Pseudoalteromonas sp. PA2MD11]
MSFTLNTNKSSIITFVVVFLFIVGWRLLGVGILDISIITSCLMFIMNPRTTWRVLPNKLVFLISSMSFVILALYVVLTTQGLDLSLLTRSVRVPLGILGGVGLAIWCLNRGLPKETILTYIALAITLNAIFVLLMFALPSFRAIIYNLTGALDTLNYTTTIAAGIRNPGLTYGLSQTSIFQAIGTLISLHIFRAVGTNNKTKMLMLVFVVVNTISCFFIGRAGLLLSIVFIALYGVTNVKRLIVLAGLVILVLFYYFSFTSELEKEEVKVQVERAEEIINVLQGESTNTTENMEDMFHLPEGVSSIIGGYGMGRSEYFYTDSDVGYVRIIYAVGVLGLILYMLNMAYVLLSVDKGVLKISEPFLIISVVFFVLNFKELFFYSRNIWQAYCVLFGLSVVYMNGRLKGEREY